MSAGKIEFSVIIKVWLSSIFVPEYHHDIIRSQRTVTYTVNLGLKNSTLILVNLLLILWNWLIFEIKYQKFAYFYLGKHFLRHAFASFK